MEKVKEKKERALNTRLFIKGERCGSPKCALIRKPYRPGQHGQKRRRGALSEYGKQLHEKQKAQIIYGVTAGQLRALFRAGTKDSVLRKLEKRIDRVVFLMGAAASLRIARQYVSHGHITLDGRKVTVPSIEVKKGQVVAIKEKSRKAAIFQEVEARMEKTNPPSWLKVDPKKAASECLGEPQIDLAVLPFDVNLVGEFYAR